MKSGEPNVQQLEPHRGMAATVRGVYFAADAAARGSFVPIVRHDDRLPERRLLARTICHSRFYGVRPAVAVVAAARRLELECPRECKRRQPAAGERLYGWLDRAVLVENAERDRFQ